MLRITIPILMIVSSLIAAESKLGPPKIRVANNDTIIRIENTGTANWSELVVYLNGTPPGGYKVTVKAPSVGSSVSIPLKEFAKKDGTRFLPHQLKVTEIWVGGGGYDFKRYNGAK